MFIAVEGIDGTGKTTVTDLLAEHSQVIKLPKNPDNHVIVSDLARQLKSNEDTYHFLDLVGLVTQSPLIQDRAAGDRMVIVDRWLGSTVASHALQARHAKANPLPIDYALLPIAIPDVVILLSADDRVRAARLAARGDANFSDWLSLQPGAQDLFLHKIRNIYASDIILDIDTSIKTPEEVCDFVAAHLRIKI